MSNLTKGLILVAVILAIGAGLVVWKKKAGHEQSYSSISKHEIELLLADVAANNPMGIKRLADDPLLRPGGAVPFYRMQHNRFIRDFL